MLVARYTRVSTGRQEKEETIENQIMVIDEFVKKNGHNIVKDYQDNGWSGSILARPGLDELRLDARKKVWEAVVIYDPDRLARKYSYQEIVAEELNELGIQVLYVTTPPPKDDQDRLLYGVKGLFAEYERGRITERFRLGKLRKARSGSVVTSQAPYGYDYIPKQATKDGYYRVNKAEAAVVKMIFHWVADDRLTLREVVRKLQELGIPPRKRKKQTWATSTLVNMFRNETYIGKAFYNRSEAIIPENPLKNEKYKKVKKTSRKMKPKEDWIEIKVPKIIDKELFERAQQQLKANFELCNRNKKNDYLLAKLIYCTCGRRRTGEGPQQGKHLYYRCSDRVHSFPLPPKCKERGVNARVADKLVWDHLVAFMSNTERIKKEAAKFMGNKNDAVITQEADIDSLISERERLNKEEERYVKAYGAGLLSMEQIKEPINDLKMKIAILDREIGKIQNERREISEVVLPSDNELKEFSEAARYVLTNKLSFEAKQAIIRKVVDKVIGQQRQLRVRGYLPVEDIQYVKFQPNCRNRGSPECGKVHFVQCFIKKANGLCGEFSICNN